MPKKKKKNQKESEPIENQNKKIKFTIPDETKNIDNSQPDMNKLTKLFSTVSQTSSKIKNLERQQQQTTKMIIPLVKNMNSEQIMESFDQSLCAQLSSQFQECKTKAEQNLLAVVEALAKCAAEQYLKNSSSSFILTIASSNLPKVIENGLNARIKSADDDNEEEEEDGLDWMHDDVTLQLSRIFCYLTNISFFNHKIVFHSGLVIKFYIGCLVSYMNKLCKDATNIQKKNIKESNEYENVKKSIRLQIEELSDYLIAVKFGTIYQRKRIEFANVVDMNEEIEPLFHINCPSSLKCSRKIAFPESIDAEQLHLQALEVLSQFQETMNKPKLYSVDSGSIVAHLAPIIIYFAAQTPYWRNYSLTNKLQLLSLDMNDSTYSEQQFHIFLTLLHNIMVHNNRLASSVVSYSNLLPILISLTFTTQKLDQITDIKQSMIKAREQCIDMISEICQHCDQQIQHKVLVEMKFARSLALAACLGGGIEDNNSIIKSAKISFDSIIHPLIETLNEQQQYSSVRSCILEEIEFEGGFEEFDAEDIQSVNLIPFTRFPIFTRIIVHIQQ